MFEGKASQYYLKHIIENRIKEPYIKASYSHFKDYSIQEELAAAINNKIFFAGEAYAAYGYDQATVHGAGQSAYAAIELMLKSS